MKRINAIIFVSIKLLLSFTTTVVARKPVTIPNSLPNRLHKIRGGAGPLNPSDTVKIATYVVGTQGALGALAPAKVNSVFGLPSNPLDDFLVKRSGTIFFSFALLVWELALNGSDLTRAVGVSAIPVVVEILHALLNGDITFLGYGHRQQYLLLAFWSLVAYTTLTGSEYADLFVKASALVYLGVGLFSYFFPHENLKSFGSSSPIISTGTKAQMKAFASFMLAIGVTTSSLIWGNNIGTLKAVGYGWIPLAVFLVDGVFVSQELVELHMNQGIMLFWLVLNLIVAGTLAF